MQQQPINEFPYRNALNEVVLKDKQLFEDLNKALLQELANYK